MKNFKIILKTSLITCALVLFSTLASGQEKHIGLWKGVDNNEVGYINLMSDGYAYIVLDKDTLGGRVFIRDGIKAKMMYKINYTSNPISIDFIITRVDNNKELGRIMGILKFIDDTIMRLRISFDNKTRPKDFLSKNDEDSVLLEKVKQ